MHVSEEERRARDGVSPLLQSCKLLFATERGPERFVENQQNNRTSSRSKDVNSHEHINKDINRLR